MSWNSSRLRLLWCAPLLALATGCATIVGEPTQAVPVESTPSDAAVVITDERGKDVFKGTTPTTATLRKSDGSYWGGKSYTVTVSRQGYEPVQVPVLASPNGWYLAGNLFFGSFIGWFAVDPWFGDMYSLSPGEVDASLPERASDAAEAGISVLLLEQEPKALSGQLERIGRADAGSGRPPGGDRE